MKTEIKNIDKEVEIENDLIKKLMEKRAYLREKNRLNYHKRKEAGTLKKPPSQAKRQTEYVYKTKNLKDTPTIDVL